jgi:DUF1680 family protein
MDVAFTLEGNFPESGNFVLSVTGTKAAIFSIALRVPEWCTNFTAKVGGNIYKGIADQFVTINKNWTPGEKILISFDMPVKNIAGGKSYPNQIAFQRGPQILALDNRLNSSTINDLLSNTKDILIGNLKLTNESKVLPTNWIGKQAYSLNIINKNEKIVLVPFAEASQTGGEMRVWLPLDIKNK